METHHAVAELPFRDAAANCNDRAASFRDPESAAAAIGVKNLLDVCPADPQAGDFYEDFASPTSVTGTLRPDDTLFRVTPARMVLGIGPKSCRPPGLCPSDSFRRYLLEFRGGQPWLRTEFLIKALEN